MGKKKVREIIKLYLRDLRKKIKIDKAVLFGSYAKGDANKESDIDLVILSQNFKGMDTDRRFDLLYRTRENPKTWTVGMDIFGFTPEEYENASPLTTLGEVKETGVIVS